MKYSRMCQISIVICFSILSICCGKKNKSETETLNTKEPNEQNETPTKLLKYTHDATEGIASDAEPAFEVIAEIYEAPALPLGEVYSSRKQLSEATRKVAELTNIVKSAEPGKLEENDCWFITEAIMSELGEIIDLTVELGYYDLLMKFSTVLKFDVPVFYEVSMADDPERMFVIVISVVKLPSK